MKQKLAFVMVLFLSSCGQAAGYPSFPCEKEKAQILNQYGAPQQNELAMSWTFGAPCPNCTQQITAATFTQNPDGSCTVATTP